ncbi:twin-arginine translocation signal domain-containing protein [Halomonas salifodinae]|uniref:twin-arginine translocation signal domain-containing protein n=1 Tax=Halomonas salifodinae TaxID=438745 RepID=UPI0033B84D43
MTPVKDPQRRRFLRTLGAGGALAGGGVLFTQVTLADARSASPRDAATETTSEYRETAHVRAYYASLRD